MTALRSTLQFLAHKTAAVAVAGSIVIGGAGLALAEAGSADGSGAGETTTTEVDADVTVDETEQGAEEQAEAATEEAEDSTESEDAGEDRPDNHGFHVSQAARGVTCPEGEVDGGDETDELEATEAGGVDVALEPAPEYRNHGECVSAVARSEAGKASSDDTAEAGIDSLSVSDGSGKSAPTKKVGPPPGKGKGAAAGPGR